MIFSTITQNKLTVTADTTEIPAQYSNNIQFEFVQDTENYSGYTPTVYATLYDSSLIECADVLNAGGNVAIENGIFTIGNQILYQSGYLAVGITLTNGDENVALPPIIYKVLASVGGLSPLPPDDGEWQQVVDAYVNTLFETWSTENLTPIQNQLESLVSQAQQLQQTAANQQTQINNAISVMGDYQIVSEDPVQIRFRKGNGEYGDVIDLGDGLASKNMVNGGYYRYTGKMYSGASSDYGIEVRKIVGAYVQDGTPTPDNPVEPEFNVINNFNTNGGNLFDASKLSTYSQGGATVTNNGDGSFTVSGSGSLSSTFSFSHNYTHEESIKLLQVNKTIYAKESSEVVPTIVFRLQKGGGVQETISPLGYTITEEDIENPNFYIQLLIYGASGTEIKTGTYKPMFYQDGDGTWYPFNASNTPVSLELRALPDGTADVWEDGNTTTNVAKVTFDNNSNWVTYTGKTVEGMSVFNVQSASSPIQEGESANKLICNILKPIDPTQSFNISQLNTIRIGNGSSTVYVCVDSTQFPTLDDWKTYLQSNPLNVYYPLATPTTEPLEIPTLTSYYPFTNAWCDSQVPGMITWNVLTGNVKNDELDPAIQEYVANNVPAMITSAINSALASYCPFAVGDIYITSLSANPNTKYPGTTWQAISGETLVGYLKDDPNFGTLGASVGEATHTLSVDEMPSHTHGAGETSNAFVTSGTGENAGLVQGRDSYILISQTSSAGGGQAHNNIQPSRVVMIWQRTA